MDPYRKRYLWLNSILIFLLCQACHISKYNHAEGIQNLALSSENLKPVFTSDGGSKKFKATIDVLTSHFSGLVIIKQTDSLTKHIIFITELGMTMFDFELKDTSINAAYVFEPLNKPRLLTALKTNFRNMMLSDIYNRMGQQLLIEKDKTVFSLKNESSKRFFSVDENAALLRQETFHKRKRLSKIDYLYLGPGKGYAHIKSIQYGIVKIRIELNQISD